MRDLNISRKSISSRVSSYSKESREETTAVKLYINSRPNSSIKDSWNCRGRQQQQGCQNPVETSIAEGMLTTVGDAHNIRDWFNSATDRVDSTTDWVNSTTDRVNSIQLTGSIPLLTVTIMSLATPWLIIYVCSNYVMWKIAMYSLYSFCKYIYQHRHFNGGLTRGVFGKFIPITHVDGF